MITFTSEIAEMVLNDMREMRLLYFYKGDEKAMESFAEFSQFLVSKMKRMNASVGSI